jgi:hypothetical protein
LIAIAANFKARNHDMELAVPLNLTLQPVEKIALKFHNLAATQACHVNVITLWASFIVVLFALHMHEIKFVYQAVALEQVDGAIYGDAVDLGIDASRFPQNLAGIEMLLSGLHHAENRAALVGHPQPTRHEFSLQAAGRFGLRQGHAHNFKLLANQLQLPHYVVRIGVRTRPSVIL